MYTSQELDLLRAADPGVVLPGIDTPTGYQIPLSSMQTAAAVAASGAIPGFSYNAATNTYYVAASGTVLNGIDFGNATVYVIGANVTFQNCKFTATTGWYAIQAASTASNLTINDNTFDGGGQYLQLGAWISSNQTVTITNNTFLRTPSDGIDAFGGGLISGNYFSGSGYTSMQEHPDAIWVTNSTTPMLITNNFIDWTTNPDSIYYTNDCIRVTGELGPVSNLTVTGNYFLGGSSSVQAIQIAGQGAITNTSITNNYIGFANYYTFYPGPTTGVVTTGNVIYDWTNPIYSDNAWAAYLAGGLPTPTLLTASNGSVSGSSSAGPVTLYGADQRAIMYGGASLTNFVGGFGYQNIWVSYGANLFTYLAVSDSTVASADVISNFDPAKDVIDLSRVDGDMGTAGLQTFTFIGTAAFDGAGPEVRYQRNADGTTSVQAALAGDTAADMQIILSGAYTLTAANFALSAAQSAAAVAAGAALSGSVAWSWPLLAYVYSGVQGRPYTSYTSIQSGGFLVLDDLNFSASSGEIDLFGAPNQPTTALTITKAGGKETVTSQGKTDSLTFHQTETIQAGNAQAPETFVFGSGFGTETIVGLQTSGANADSVVIQVPVVSAIAGPGGLTFLDSQGDSLTLQGIGAADLAANPNLVRYALSSTRLQLLSDVAPGVPIPGVTVAAGNPLPAAGLAPLSSIPTSATNQPFWYSASNNTVYVTQAGAVLKGYNFGNAQVVVSASNVTIQNCSFTNPCGWYAVTETGAATNLTVTNCTFNNAAGNWLGAWITTGAGNAATITGNLFLNTHNDGLQLSGGGVVSGNDFSGSAGGVAIRVTNSVTPLAVSGNLIDWYQASGSQSGASCITISGASGPVSNVTVTGNMLMGGWATVSAVAASGQSLTNISIANNYLGFGTYYAFAPGSSAGVATTGNVVFDWTSATWSDNAWAAYQAAGLPTATLLNASAAAVNAAAVTGPVTLYGADQHVTLYGGMSETNFVGGAGYQNYWLSNGVNIFTYLTVADSTPASQDTITNFDPAKDVIDFSRVATNATSLLGGAAETLTFIGTAAFDGAGAEVRYQQNANGTTTVQLALAGDTAADMQISLSGLYTLTSANFALTAAQSTAATAAGAAMQVTAAPSTSWPLAETLYTNVQGRSYSSYASIQSGSLIVLDDLNFSATAGEIDLFGAPGQPSTAVTLAKGGGKETVTSQGKTVSLPFHQTETIQAANANAPETFAFSAGWGSEVINGFATSGANADTLQLSAAAFSYLNPATMTQNQELAAVLLNATSGGNGTTIVDSQGDTLTLVGVSAATLNANPALVKFV